MMDLKDAETQWTLYDANVQTYRSNSLATQSLLLAIGAFVKDDAAVLLVAFAVAMLQMWYIWFRVIRTRTIISDYYKFNFKYQFSSFVNNRGGAGRKHRRPADRRNLCGQCRNPEKGKPHSGGSARASKAQAQFPPHEDQTRYHTSGFADPALAYACDLPYVGRFLPRQGAGYAQAVFLRKRNRIKSGRDAPFRFFLDKIHRII